MRATGIRPEGARYRAGLVFLPGLWSPAEVWREPAAFFAHRGWSGESLHLLDVGGGIAARATAVASHLGGSAHRVVIAHDAGAAVALAAGEHGARFAAIVLVAPLLQRDRRLAALVARWDAAWALLTGAPVPPPQAGAWRPPDAAVALTPDDPVAVLDIVRGRSPVYPPSCPTLIVGGADDALVPPDSVRRLATILTADVHLVPEAGHWPHLGSSWTAVVSAIHRWLVTRLGEFLLETYSEAMADRGDDDA